VFSSREGMTSVVPQTRLPEKPVMVRQMSGFATIRPLKAAL
jgi:hypothetical protein